MARTKSGLRWNCIAPRDGRVAGKNLAQLSPHPRLHSILALRRHWSLSRYIESNRHTLQLFACRLCFRRLQWPGRGICFAALLGTMMIPAQVTMIPQFLIMQKLGWYNTLKPLWVMSFFGSAFSIFLLREFLKGIPRDLEDAARLDGCGFLRIYWHIMLPLCAQPSPLLHFTSSHLERFMGPLIY